MGIWKASYKHGKYAEICEGEYAIFRSDEAKLEDIQRTNWAVAAYNNTFGRGIEPSAVPMMKDALIEARSVINGAYRNGSTGRRVIEHSLESIDNALKEAGVEFEKDLA